MGKLAALVLAGGMCLAAQEPADFKGWLNQGVQFFKSAHYAEAVASFERAAALDPANPVGHLYLGTAYMQQYIPGSTAQENVQAAQRAEEQFQRVIGVDPQNKTALASIASLELNQKKFDDALGWYEKLIAADPGNADAYYTLGFVAWSKWYPVYARARQEAGLRPETPGPIPDAAVRQSLNREYGPMLQAGIDALARAMEIRPEYADAMAYTNLLIRERADLRDNAAEYQQDIASADQWVQKALAAKKAQAGRQSSGGLTMTPAPPPPPPPPPAPAGVAQGEMPRRIRITGNVQQANLITRVAPAATSFKGDVVLAVVIGRDGSVQDIRVTEGHPMLIQPALDAVKQWKYRPTLLNGVPVEVETQVTVTF